MNRFLAFIGIVLCCAFFQVKAQTAAKEGYNSFGEIHCYWERTDGSWAHFYNPITYFRVTDSTVLFYSPIDGFKKLENVPEMQVTDLFFAEKPKDVFYFEAKNQNFKEGFASGNKVTALGTLVFASLNIKLPIDVVKLNTYYYEINYQGDIQKRTMIWPKAVQAQFTGKFRLEVRNINPPKKK